MSQKCISIALCMFVVFAAMVAGCDSGGGPTEPDGALPAGETGGGAGQPSGPEQGMLQIMMIDAPTDEICELHVYIRDLRVKPDGQPQMLLGTDIGDFDLLALQDGPPAVLGSFPVEQGLYQFVEILLDGTQSYVIEKEDPSDPANANCLTAPSPLQVPSAKFKVAGGPFAVDGNTTITIDFDAAKSLRRKGGSGSTDSGWQLKPDVSVTNVEP